MATDVTKLNFLDEAGVQKLAEYLLQASNSRIKERILTTVNDGAYTDQQHVLAAQAILTLIGKLADYSTDAEPDSNTVIGLVKGLKKAIGAASDASSSSTVYGAIAKTKEEVLAKITSLTHLTYQVVTGPITNVQDKKGDVIYLQQDDTSDKEWNLYIWNATGGTGGAGEWICVGDTSLTLTNYWSKDDTDELQEALMGKIADATILSKVQAAFAATDPFGSTSASNAYLPAASNT